MLTPKVIVGLLTMVGCTVIANLLLKVGAAEDTEAELGLGAVGPKSLLGILFFGFALLLYLWLLRVLPLNVAQSLAAAQFVAIILASWMILSEAVPPLRWLGIAMIACGIVIVGLTVGGRAGR